MEKMIDAYKRFFSNYAYFNGRSTRSDYWYVFLANFLISFILGFIGGLIPVLSDSLSTLSSLYSLAVLIPGIALVVRRLHDINKSGWYCFMVLIPIAGFIIMIVYLCTDSVNENNQYGTRV